MDRLYIEITNHCGLNCSFCPPDQRPHQAMTQAEFSGILPQVAPWVGRLYFHVKGEPLLHPDIGRFLSLAGQYALPVHLTSNGLSLASCLAFLHESPALRRFNLSLQAIDELPEPQRKTRLAEILDSARSLSATCHVSLRLWNRGQSGFDDLLPLVAEHFGLEPTQVSDTLIAKNGAMLGPNLSLHAADRFAWPRLPSPATKADTALDKCAPAYCLGLVDQAAILSNGDVVPCCLDDQGAMVLGNIHRQSWESIIEGSRASAIRQGFERGLAAERLCQACTFRQRFAQHAQRRRS